MKIKLLNDGDYGDMDSVKFPVIVDAEMGPGYFDVIASELYRIGANSGEFGESNETWAFLNGEHAEEVIE